MSGQIAKVAVENAAYSFDDAFDYAIPQNLQKSVVPGVRVLVPFGNGNKKRQGFVFALRTPKDGKKLKNIAAVLDKAPLLNNELLRMAVFLKEHTFCTLFDAAKAMLPSGIGLHFVLSFLTNPDLTEENLHDLSETERAVWDYLSEKGVYVKKDTILKALGLKSDVTVLEEMTQKGLLYCNTDTQRKIGDATVRMVRLTKEWLENDAPCKVTKKQKDVLTFLENVGTASVKEICYFTGVTTAVISTLHSKKLIDYFENEIFRRPKFEKQSSIKAEIHLTEEQQKAYTGLLQALQSEKSKTALLFGVTGSGKTQVFLKLIDDTLEKGRGVIVMVPEISLTPQMLSIFYERYGSEVAVFHSALSMGERLDEWKRVKKGEAKIALGTRSAVFAPLSDIGLIIMDEEQEHTYKSEMTPRYHARDVAAFRVKNHNALLLLASATPSLESYARAESGQYALYTLENRYGNALLPEVLTVDAGQIGDRNGLSNISAPLMEALSENLKAGNQSILLLNRRGYNTFAACNACGTVKTCPNCSISLTYHARNNRLMCHYCGYSEPFTTVCRECGEDAVAYSGFGTQRLEDELSEALPEARILRLDTDSTASRYSFENALKKFTNYEYDIMVGTQMVAKGLDFPRVTLVGVVSVDQMLYNDDYKSAERTFDLLTQVVGRSGRGELAGKAIIQTAFPDNEIIRLAQKQDFRAFYNLEMKIRRAMVYPPFCDICTIGFIGTDEQLTKAAAKVFLEQLKALHKEKFGQMNLIALGPIAPRLAKVSGKFRFRIILKCHNDAHLRLFVSTLLKDFSKNNTFKKITVIADINPENIY